MSILNKHLQGSAPADQQTQTKTPLGSDCSVANNIAFIALVIVYAVCAWTVGIHHEPWADEAQAWLIARDETLWNILFFTPHYEGTPTLWHVILHFAQMAGLQYKYLFTVPIACNICAIILLWYKSPFHPLVKLLLPFTYFIFYQYGIIARSYSLIFLAISIVATIFPKRFTKSFTYLAALVLFASISSHTYVISIALLGCYILEVLNNKPLKWSNRPLLALYASVLLYLLIAYSCIPAPDCQFVEKLDLCNIHDFAIMLVNNVANASVCNVTEGMEDPKSTGIPQVIAMIGFLLLLCCHYRDRNWKDLCYPLALYGAILGFMSYVYTRAHHCGIPFFTAVLLLWIHPLEIKKFTVACKILVIVSITAVFICQIRWSYISSMRDIREVYCSSRQVAAVLHRCLTQKPNLKIQVGNYMTVAISPYFECCPFHTPNYRHGYWDWRNKSSKLLIADPSNDMILMYGHHHPELDGIPGLIVRRFKSYSYFKDVPVERDDDAGFTIVILGDHTDLPLDD